MAIGVRILGASPEELAGVERQLDAPLDPSPVAPRLRVADPEQAQAALAELAAGELEGVALRPLSRGELAARVRGLHARSHRHAQLLGIFAHDMNNMLMAAALDCELWDEIPAGAEREQVIEQLAGALSRGVAQVSALHAHALACATELGGGRPERPVDLRATVAELLDSPAFSHFRRYDLAPATIARGSVELRRALSALFLCAAELTRSGPAPGVSLEPSLGGRSYLTVELPEVELDDAILGELQQPFGAARRRADQLAPRPTAVGLVPVAGFVHALGGALHWGRLARGSQLRLVLGP